MWAVLVHIHRKGGTMCASEVVSHELPVVVDPKQGQGILLITDHSLLLKPPVPGQHHEDCPFDSAHIIEMMNLGDQSKGYGIDWHVSTGLGWNEARRLLAPVWKSYFGYYSKEKALIDAAAYYYVDGDVDHALQQQFGKACNGEHGSVFVYTREFWLSIHPSGDPTQTDWAPLLKEAGLIDPRNSDEVLLKDLQKTFARGQQATFANDLVIVSPSENPPDYTARCFKIGKK